MSIPVIKKISHKIQEYLNQRRYIPKDYPFIMYPEEKSKLLEILNHSHCYLEFGTGGSTIFTLINSNVPIISVDSNEAWIKYMKKYNIIRRNLNNRLKIYLFNIGPTRSWRYPINNDNSELFPAFSSKVFELEDPKKIDVVLVDGRFRVACVLQTIIHCYQNNNLRILIHDYPSREGYKIVEEFLDVIDSVKLLYVFKVKENINLDDVHKAYDIYKYIPD